jgi:hypothetical protein
MHDSSPNVTKTAEPTSRAHVRPAATEAELAEAWFDAPPSTRRPSVPPAPVSVVGEFIGDPLADGWLR